MAAFTDLDVLRKIPGYQAIMKGVLKNLIQILIDQLSMTTGEESVILTASTNDGSLSQLGSESGKDFLQENEDFKSKFLGFCLRRQHMKKTTGTATPKMTDNSQSQQSSLQKATSVTQIAIKRRAGLSQSSPYFARRQSSTVSSLERQPSILTEQASMEQQFSRNEISEQTIDKEEPSQQTVIDTESSEDGVVKQELSEEVEITGVTYGFPDVTVTSSNVILDSDSGSVEFPTKGGETTFEQTQWYQKPSEEKADLGDSSAETSDLSKPEDQVVNKSIGEHSQEYIETLFKPSKLFKCDICEKVFTRAGDKARHMRSHTGEKPFECTFCDRRFSRKDNMKTHIVTNHACKLSFT